MSAKELTQKERQLLEYCLQQHRPDLLPKLAELDSTVTDKTLIDELRGAVGLEIAAKGFYDSKESYDYGIALESLIDKLGELYLWPDLKRGRGEK